ncbi:MAG: phosphoglucomutase/phosphomannomutase family protein [Deltaproteobacteria bacterium]|nr:phosphoglucomutase/phosphomannomutase family protein [Deltaproteobacteria bacterium]MBW2420538.1 phosphoglucomutase/phosphomannomutase family protein [Deltaproteobacteria bacterium]
MVDRARSGEPEVIRFGTSGWRGVLGEEITFPRLRIAVRACARWFARQGQGDRILVGFDGRFASERMARTACTVLSQEGLAPQLAGSRVPTPVVAEEILRRRAAGALVLTASHNPPEYHGMKVLGAWGGSLTLRDTRCVEELAAAAVRRRGFDAAAGGAELWRGRGVDLVTPYRARLEGLLDLDALRRSKLLVVYDAMHGAGAGVLDEVLIQAGVAVELHRGQRDPTFGGVPPDPVAERLAQLARAVRGARGLRLGLATDGDADRLGVMDEGGRLLSSTQVLALLIDQLARRGRVRKGVAISIATGSLVEKVALDHGLPIQRTPVGFKYLSTLLVEGSADVAGEESGGFALGRFARDKDGILAGALLAEGVASGRKPLGARVAELEGRFGRSACGSRSLDARPALCEGLERLRSAPPGRVGDAKVREVDVTDGVHLRLDDGFVMLRASGTEPVIRVYGEARGPRLLTRLLDRGERLLAR